MVTKGYGFTVEDIDWSCPADLQPYGKAHVMELKETDRMLYNMGVYNKSAFGTVMADFAAGFAGKKSRAKYMSKTIFEQLEDEINKKKQTRTEYRNMTKEEQQEKEWKRAESFFNSFERRFKKKGNMAEK